ncbi:MAG: hypothetical protein HYY92_03460 [Parcubacteria group bacterium]|nr:hypothetical protein [Parcubacteria group bacterium]
MRNPEDAFLSGLSKKLAQEKLYAKTEEILRENQPLNPENFRDLYGDENVNKDTARVRKLEEGFREGVSTESEQGRKLAKALEVIIAQQIELSNWMGSDVITITPSLFDDFINGVDLITEFQDKGEGRASHMALAIDVTSGGDLTKKIERIKGEIRNGDLARVKYFESEFLNIRGELKNIPRVVVGIDTHTMESLGELWLANDTKALAGHEVQRALLEEIRAELKAFAAYARHAERLAGPERHERSKKAAEVYERTLQVIEEILEEKKSIALETMANDSVFRSIMRELEFLQKGY